MRTADHTAFTPSRNSGMTLIELMVALGIGSFLMVGALTVFMQSRTTFRVNESIARLQENARYVFDVMEPDIRMAHYWGLRTRAFVIDGRANDDVPLATAVGGDCGANWAIDLDQAVESSNNDYNFTCAAFGTEIDTADTLVVRRANPDVAAVLEDRLYIQSSRSDNSAVFFGDDGLPGGFLAATSETHVLIVNGYYIDQNSTLDFGGDAVPSLRRKSLIAGPSIEDQEVLPGVEDMQIQFGVDTDPVDGNDRGIVDRYVNPDDPILVNDGNADFNPDAEILSVRIWLRLRADRPEIGLPENNGFTYADQVVDPINDGFRRIVVSRTIYLRNARPAS